MTPVEILKAARELISDRARWTQRVSARYENGLSCWLYDQAAVCWCASAAICIVADKCVSTVNRQKAESAFRCVIDTGIATFNDSHTHREVLDAFDSAIIIAEPMALRS